MAEDPMEAQTSDSGVDTVSGSDRGDQELHRLKTIIEGALLAAARPVRLEELEGLFQDDERPDRNRLRQAIQALQADYEDRAMELRQVASGFRIQVREKVSDWVSRLWEERPTRYSRALLETLALIAYRQPITRGEIEEVRGVSVSSSIIRTLQERGWIKVVGHRDVPGRPAMFGSTREFLDYFGLKSLDELPTLAEIRDIDSINVELELDNDADEGRPEASSEGTGQDAGASNEAVEGAEDGIIEDAEQGDSVDERHLGQVASEDPFEEAAFEEGNGGEELDFEDADEQTQDEEDRLETRGEAEETQGAGSEASAEEGDEEADREPDGEDVAERGRSGH
ncbi:SMC-Scp complex subunit ScpB [Natronospira bacteriovora]|uniref:SMC-Scp complex subunit ScpB n=1 Tax=Natronospira bacteriovora TaxID=3069753 RepID=UPI0035B525D7